MSALKVLPFSFIFLSLGASAAQAAVGCFEEGECTGGKLLDYTQTETAEECAVACGGFDGCNYFTHFSISNACFFLDDCPVLDQDCVDCVSGREGCSCFELGKCDGTMIHTSYTLDEFVCLNVCRAHDECAWVTYLKDVKLCELLEDCASIDGHFSDAVSAPKDCSNSTDEDPLHIMVALGFNGDSFLDDVEIVDLGRGDSSCMKPPAYPLEMWLSCGAFIDGKARICGGDTREVGGTSDCYEYQLGDGSWALSDYSLSEARVLHEGFVLANGSWLIVGGWDSSNTTDVYSSEVITRGPDLPFCFYTPIGTTVNSTHIWLASGWPNYTSFLINVDTWEFTQMPDMMEVERSDFSCGMVENKSGERELVVAGGQFVGFLDSVEIFNFGSWSWREGPRLTQAFQNREAVQLSKTFLIIGGQGDHGYLDTIYEFDNMNYKWILRNETLETSRENHVAIPLPKDWDVCTIELAAYEQFFL